MHAECGADRRTKPSSDTFMPAARRPRRGGGHHVRPALGNGRARMVRSSSSAVTPNLFIRPPYKFQVVDAMLTNFHLPRTTLLVLVRTFGGDELIRGPMKRRSARSIVFTAMATRC